MLHSWVQAVGARNKRKAIEQLLASHDWIILHINRDTGCSIYTEKKDMDHALEIHTARALTAMDYDVLFAPAAMFSREEKRFDVFLIRAHVMLKADLKTVSSKNPNTIAKSITGGAEQASRRVLDIVSDISVRDLVDGLCSGIAGQKGLVEIMVFYRNRFHVLRKQDIIGKRIYKILS